MHAVFAELFVRERELAAAAAGDRVGELAGGALSEPGRYADGRAFRQKSR